MDRYFKSFHVADLVEQFKNGIFTIYSRQRPVDLERIKEINLAFTKIYETEKKIPIRGCLVFAFFAGKYHLIDGQHRYIALMEVFEKINLNFEIMCEILIMQNAGQIFVEFVNINKAVPVPIYCLNPSETVDTVVKWVHENYPQALCEKKIIPKMAISAFKDSITILVGKCINNAPEQMIRTLASVENSVQNSIENSMEYFLSMAAGYDTKKMNIIKNVIKNRDKKMTNKLYIGLYYTKSWMDLFIIHNEKIQI